MKNVYYIESHPEPGLWKKEVELSNGNTSSGLVIHKEAIIIRNNPITLTIKILKPQN